MADKITYTNKVGIQNDEEVPIESKVTDDNMNEIKQVVNSNADEQNDLADKVNNFENYDDTEIKKDISDIKQEQQTQNKNIENLQTNDNKQDELISKLKNALINAETEESKSIHVEDASTIGQLEVLGNHGQKTREGYNKYDYLKNLVGSIAGLTVTKDDENGYVIVNGTPEYNYAVISTLVDITDNLEDKQTYTMWAENHYGNNDAGIYLQVRITKITDGTVQYLTTGNVNRTFTVDKSLYTYKANIQIGTVAVSGTFNNSKNRFMIYKGTDKKEFELYGATPSPEYPSPVICLGSNTDGSFKGSTEISKINKNIYDITKYPFTNRIAYNSSGEQVFWAGYCGILDYFSVKGNTQYTFSNNLNKPIYCGLVFYNKDKQVISAISTNTTTFTTPENCKYIRFAIQSDTLPTWVQIEVGNTATSNVEHQQEDYLLYIQQEMLEGDYFVKEEDGWKEVHGWNKIESYNGESITTEYISTTGELTIGATIFYKTEQYKLPCTEEQIAVLEELNNLDLYKPVTNIITTEDIALLKLKYSLDVETYVDNKLNTINQQILEIAGGNG